METKITMETETGLKEKPDNNKSKKLFIRKVLKETQQRRTVPQWQPDQSGMLVTSSSLGFDSTINTYLRRESKFEKYNTSRNKTLDP